MSAAFPFRSLLAGALLASTASHALALDADEFAKALNEAYATQGGEIAFSSADLSGDTITLRDAHVRAMGTNDAASGLDIVFSGVSENGDGSYDVDLLTIPEISFKEDKGAFFIGGIEVSGLEVPTPNAEAPDMIFYDAARTGRISVSNEDGEVFSATGSQTTVDREDDGAKYAMASSVDGVKINLSLASDGKAKAALDAMGYETVEGRIVMEGVWSVNEGTVDLPEFALDLDDVGRLSIGMKVNGYTSAWLKQLQSMQKTMMASDGDPKAQQAASLAMLGLMQQLSFANASIRFDDDSLTGKALDYAGSQQGVSGDQMAQGLGAMLPMMLGRLNNPELQAQIATAAKTFLADPQSLTVTASPANPVPLGMVLGAAMANPTSLPQILGVSVSANE